MILSIGGLVVVLLLVIEMMGYYGARRYALAELEQEGGLLARYQAERVRTSLGYAETASEFLLRTLAIYDRDNDTLDLEKLLSNLLNGNQQISAVEIHGLPEGRVAMRRTADGTLQRSEVSFRVPKLTNWSVAEQQDGRWILPQSNPDALYLHHVQKINDITLVIQVPVRLLAKPMEQTEGSVAYGFLATGAVVLFTNSTIPAERMSERYEFISRILMKRSAEGNFFRVLDPIYGKAAWVGIAPVGDLDLTVGVVYLEGENFRPLYGLAWGTLILGVLGIGALLLAISLTARSVARPLVELSDAVESAATRGFSQRVKIPRNATTEVERLATSYNHMLEDLTHFIGRLEDAAHERQALESELIIAANIQSSMLPKFPFQDRHCEAVGMSSAARKVGGDFLNIFPVGADRIGFFIGDVSGKGIPGAITMAFTASLLEHLGRVGLPPQECLAAVNRALCAKEEANSFVTVFFGVLGMDGVVTYANAGHHPPIVFLGEQGPRIPEIDSGLPLGIFPEARFGQGRFKLLVQERLLLYTDGVIEAMNKEREEYGEERFESSIRTLSSEQDLAAQLDYLCAQVDRFRDGAAPNDDTTVLLLRPLGR